MDVITLIRRRLIATFRLRLSLFAVAAQLHNASLDITNDTDALAAIATDPVVGYQY